MVFFLIWFKISVSERIIILVEGIGKNGNMLKGGVKREGSLDFLIFGQKNGQKKWVKKWMKKMEFELC